MTTRRIEGGLYYDAERRAIQRRDRDMIPRGLVLAIAALALSALCLAAYARLADRPLSGSPEPAPVVESRIVTLEGDGVWVRITDIDGTVIRDMENGAFIAVVIDALERQRIVHGITGNPPVTVARLANGRLVLDDPATGWSIELTSFGAGNTRYWNVVFEN